MPEKIYFVRSSQLKREKMPSLRVERVFFASFSLFPSDAHRTNCANYRGVEEEWTKKFLFFLSDLPNVGSAVFLSSMVGDFAAAKGRGVGGWRRGRRFARLRPLH